MVHTPTQLVGVPLGLARGDPDGGDFAPPSPPSLLDAPVEVDFSTGVGDTLFGPPVQWWVSLAGENIRVGGAHGFFGLPSFPGGLNLFSSWAATGAILTPAVVLGVTAGVFMWGSPWYTPPRSLTWGEWSSHQGRLLPFRLVHSLSWGLLAGAGVAFITLVGARLRGENFEIWSFIQWYWRDRWWSCLLPRGEVPTFFQEVGTNFVQQLCRLPRPPGGDNPFSGGPPGGGGATAGAGWFFLVGGERWNTLVTRLKRLATLTLVVLFTAGLVTLVTPPPGGVELVRPLTRGAVLLNEYNQLGDKMVSLVEYQTRFTQGGPPWWTQLHQSYSNGLTYFIKVGTLCTEGYTQLLTLGELNTPRNLLRGWVVTPVVPNPVITGLANLPVWVVPLVGATYLAGGAELVVWVVAGGVLVRHSLAEGLAPPGAELVPLSEKRLRVATELVNLLHLERTLTVHETDFCPWDLIFIHEQYNVALQLGNTLLETATQEHTLITQGFKATASQGGHDPAWWTPRGGPGWLGPVPTPGVLLAWLLTGVLRGGPSLGVAGVLVVGALLSSHPGEAELVYSTGLVTLRVGWHPRVS